MPKTKMPKPAARVYRAASYARLSVDDESYGTSGSVLNQHAMIRDFAYANGGLSIVAEYSDDGFSGSTFENRPGWGSLLADLEAGKIDCIVVKDLSRLGRNYLDVSRYLDQVFPALGVRVVAIADGYDSVAEKTPADALMLPVKNLFNDMYCRDASAKTKASLSAKRRRGEFVGAFAPYGYAKGSGPDRGRLVIDPEPAGVVRGIFDARIGGMSAAGIAAMLNEGLVPSPYEYFAAKGAARSANFCKGKRAAWDARTVLRILSNEAYTGTLVQGKTCKPDFRRKAVLPVDESEWDRSPGAHEAIVDPATFGLVRKLARRDMRLSPGAKRSLPLSGFLFCADCGATMARHASRCAGGKRFYYSCETHRKNRVECGMHKVWEDELSAAVMRAVHGHALAAVDGDGAVRGAEAYRHDRRAELACRLESVEGRIEHNGDLRLRMYSDYAAGVIDKAQYAELVRAVDARLQELKGEKAGIERESAQLDDVRAETWEQTLARYRDAEGLERVMVVELIDRVLVGEGGDIEVVFRFGGPVAACASRQEGVA